MAKQRAGQGGQESREGSGMTARQKAEEIAAKWSTYIGRFEPELAAALLEAIANERDEAIARR